MYSQSCMLCGIDDLKMFWSFAVLTQHHTWSHTANRSVHEFDSLIAETESGSEDEDMSEDEGTQTLSEEEEERKEQGQAGGRFAYPDTLPRR